MVIAINISEKKGTIKHSVQQATLIDDYGIQGDAHAGKWHRQVSILSYESFLRFKEEIKVDLQYGVFGENLLISEVDISKINKGDKVHIGDSVLEVTQIGKSCHKGCEIRDIVGKCIMPMEGIFARVIKGGQIKEGDKVWIEYIY